LTVADIEDRVGVADIPSAGVSGLEEVHYGTQKRSCTRFVYFLDGGCTIDTASGPDGVEPVDIKPADASEVAGSRVGSAQQGHTFHYVDGTNQWGETNYPMGTDNPNCKDWWIYDRYLSLAPAVGWSEYYHWQTNHAYITGAYINQWQATIPDNLGYSDAWREVMIFKSSVVARANGKCSGRYVFQWDNHTSAGTNNFMANAYWVTALILDVDIEINMVDTGFTTDDSAIGFDLRSTLQHETGHLLGLAHSPDADSVMNEVPLPGSIAGRAPSADDLSAICEIYPPDEAAIDAACDPTRSTSRRTAAEHRTWLRRLQTKVAVRWVRWRPCPPATSGRRRSCWLLSAPQQRGGDPRHPALHEPGADRVHSSSISRTAPRFVFSLSVAARTRS
jgi:hypothetical protein